MILGLAIVGAATLMGSCFDCWPGRNKLEQTIQEAKVETANQGQTDSVAYNSPMTLPSSMFLSIDSTNITRYTINN